MSAIRPLATPSAPRVEIVASIAGIEAIAAEWCALERRCPERFGYFQSHAWCAAWAQRFLSGRHALAEPHVVCVRRGGRLALLWPAMASAGPLGTRLLQTLGEPHTQYSTALFDPDLADRAAIDAFVASLQHGAGDVAILDMVPAPSLLARALAGIASPAGAGNETAFLRLEAYPTWQAYLASLPPAGRRSRRDRQKRLARHGEPSFRVLWPAEAGYAPLVARCIAWKRRWLEETGRFSRGFAIGGCDAFLASLPGDAARLDGAVAFELALGGEPVAVEIGFIHANHFYSYIGGFDWERRSLSGGKVLMEMAMRWLHEAGVASYDLLGNPAEYKSSWSDTTVPLHSYVLPASLRGRIVGQAWFNGLRPVLKRVYGAMPAPVRRVLLPPVAAGAARR